MEVDKAIDALGTQIEEGIGADRGGMYERYLQSQGQEPPQKDVKAAGENDKPSEKDEKKAEQPPEKADSGEEPPAEKAEEEGEKPAEKAPKKDKLVPYASLKEERVKRQELGKQVSELSSKVEQLMSDNIRLMSMLKDGKVPPSDPPEGVGEYDEEIRRLKNQIKTLENRDASRNEEKLQAEIKAYYDDGIKKMEVVNADLEKEGFPGFLKFEHLVGQYFGKLKEDDPDEFEAMYNPEGWKQVYKEHIFPEIATMLGIQKKEAKKGEKVDAKQKAQLGGSPGTPPPGKNEGGSEGTAFDQYLEMRRKSGIT